MSKESVDKIHSDSYSLDTLKDIMHELKDNKSVTNEDLEIVYKARFTNATEALKKVGINTLSNDGVVRPFEDIINDITSLFINFKTQEKETTDSTEKIYLEHNHKEIVSSLLMSIVGARYSVNLMELIVDKANN